MISACLTSQMLWQAIALLPSQCVESFSYFLFVLIVFTFNIEVYYKVSSGCCLIQKYIKMYVYKEEFLLLYFICAPQVALIFKSQNFIEGKKKGYRWDDKLGVTGILVKPNRFFFFCLKPCANYFQKTIGRM